MAEDLMRKLERMAWDSGKENLPPDFKDLLKSKSITSEEIEQQRRKMLDGISSYTGSDPLKPWVRCIKWGKEQFSSGLKSELVPLLELCTQKFLKDPRYSDDLRYLRIWIRYADCCSDPIQVFSFLERNNIGQTHSLFYEAYAVILELRDDLSKAEEIYQRGISRRAQPIAQLDDMYQKFLRRKAKLVSNSAKASEPAALVEEKISQVQEAQCSETGSTQVSVCTSESVQTLPAEIIAIPACLPASRQEQRTTYRVRATEPQGDETIAIKKYAEEAIVVGIDPEAVDLNPGSHHGLVDPTINTKEAMFNVLSLFNQPLPLGQGRKPRDSNKGRKVIASSSSAAAASSGFDIFVDEDFVGDTSQNDKNQRREANSSSSSAGKGTVDIFVDDAFASSKVLREQCREPRMTSSSSSATGNVAAFDIFVDDTFAKETRRVNKPPAFEVYADEGLESTSRQAEPAGVDPWNEKLIVEQLKGLKPPLSSYKGFHQSSKKYGGCALCPSNCRNKTMELGSSTYCIKGCTGQGAFAQVYQAHDDDDYERTVVLKVQKPPCPWEFYIYRQLDKRIPQEERTSFGHAWKMHVYSDCSIMVADYGQHGTLQDVINSYLAQGQKMDELLCIYYTIELLRMLETLHSVRIIHGDFKPDNLLIRNESENWEDWQPERPGCWKDQGLCLIDWGRSIDLSLFPDGTEFIGDSRTSAFRCIEMVKGRPWTFQVDTYGLCGIVHCMLHGSYMDVQQDKSCKYKPKTPLKRYWNSNLWDRLFTTLLNVENGRSNPELGPLRKSFEDYLVSSPTYGKKLKEVLMKQSVMMYSKR